jgi:hypothetical protein
MIGEYLHRFAMFCINVGCIVLFIFSFYFLPLAWFNSRLLGRRRLVTYVDVFLA